MRTATVELKCIGCGISTEQSFKMPALLSPTVFGVTCDHCKCVVMYKLERYKNTEKMPATQLKTSARIVTPGATFLALKKEEEDLREEVKRENAK